MSDLENCQHTTVDDWRKECFQMREHMTRVRAQMEKADAVLRAIGSIGLRCSNSKCKAEDGVKRARAYLADKVEE